MADHPGRPLVFLDVDGTLLPAGGAVLPAALEDWNARWQHAANPQLARIIPGHGPRLLALPADVVWATGWMTDANTPSAWVDDELTDADRAWVSAHHPGPALLHRVDSRCGLTGADLSAAEDWLRAL